jgi:hypothetical protein
VREQELVRIGVDGVRFTGGGRQTRCGATPPSTDAIRGRGQPMESSIWVNVRGRSGAAASESSSSRMTSLQQS